MKIIAILCLFFFAYTEAKKVLCPDGAYKCPDWGTCCENRDTSYGCCPYKNADCCSDFIHCCPPGTHCNVTNRSCDSSKVSSLAFQWMVPQYHPNSISDAFDDNLISDTKLETLELKVSDHEGDVCPDGMSCNEGATCCPIGGGRFGCCPYRNAQCCGDFVHCCPYGYNCEVANGQCTKRSNTNSSENNLPIFNLEKKEFELPFEKKLCGLSNSCYLTGKVCCSHDNNEFCCPKGYTCLPESKGCKMDVPEVSGYFFFKSLTNLEDAENKLGIVCPDGTESCPVDNTCCAMLDGNYGCCPMPGATCCPDHLTCCPHNFECVGNNGCMRKSFLHQMHLPIFVERRPYNN